MLILYLKRGSASEKLCDFIFVGVLGGKTMLDDMLRFQFVIYVGRSIVILNENLFWDSLDSRFKIKGLPKSGIK